MSDIAFTHGTGSPARSMVRRGAASLLQAAGRIAWLMLARSRERPVLASLDARGLRDIGLTPDAAASEARKWFWQA